MSTEVTKDKLKQEIETLQNSSNLLERQIQIQESLAGALRDPTMNGEKEYIKGHRNLLLLKQYKLKIDKKIQKLWKKYQSL